MRVLLVSNETQACGVAEWARQCAAALRTDPNIQLDVWHPTLAQHWPAEPLSKWDVVLVSHHAGPLGFLQVPPTLPRLVFSMFLHEPDAGSALREVPRVCLISAEERPDTYFLPMPCPAYTSYREPILGLVGTSSLRGATSMQDTCAALGLGWDPGTPMARWLLAEEEVDRLARCEALVFWYGGAFSGQSSGVMMGVAAQRPILLNHNRMYESLQPYADELYFRDDPHAGLEEIMSDVAQGKARIPRRLKADRAWPRAVDRLWTIWRHHFTQEVR